MNLHPTRSLRRLAPRGRTDTPPPPARGRVWAGLVCGGLLGLLAFAPARWLAAAIPAGSPVQLAEARGTWWQGSARLWISGGAGSPDRAALPQRVHWQLSLSWSGPVLRIDAPCCTSQGLRLRLGRHQGAAALRIDDAQTVWPADLLAGLGTPWNTLQPSGQLMLRTEGLTLRLGTQGLQASGRATLDVQNLSSALSTLHPMGSYRLAVQAGAMHTLQLQTLHGELLLSGQGHWQPSGLHFRGEARAAAGREDALGNILNIIGTRDGARTLISLG